MTAVPQWSHWDAKPPRVSAYIIECPTCSYEPDAQVLIPLTRCPKCGCFAWRRLPRPGMLGDKILAHRQIPAPENKPSW